MSRGDHNGQHRPTTGVGAGDVLALFRRQPSLTRADVARLTGLARSTVNQRLDALIAAGLLHQTAEVSAARGRPAEHFAFNAASGVLLVADLGATSVGAAVCDLSGQIHAENSRPIRIGHGPEAVLTDVAALFTELLRDSHHAPTQVRGVGLDVPGPVDFTLGRVVSPPIMTGWDGFDIPGWFAPHYPCPVLVENDVNAMAWGERQSIHPDVHDLLMLKVGTGVGSGIIANGHVYRGADGAAGDIGHSQIPPIPGEDQPECRCGNTGCVEAYTGGWALVRDLRGSGHHITTTTEAVELIRAGNPDAVRLTRRAGRILGAALAGAVSLLNPSVVTIGGQLARAEDQLLAGVREMIYQRSLPLATRRLRILPSQLDERAGLVGLTYLLADRVLAPQLIEQRLAQA